MQNKSIFILNFYLSGLLEEYDLQKNPVKRKTIKTNHIGQVRCFRYIPFQNLVITGAEDGALEVNQPVEISNNEIDFEEEASKVFDNNDMEEMMELPSKKKVD